MKEGELGQANSMDGSKVKFMQSESEGKGPLGRLRHR
jgi:hypothetical protein